MMNYSDISSLKELRLVRRQLDYNIAQKERELKGYYQGLRDWLNPALWVRRALQSVESLKEVWQFVQDTWQAVRGFFRSKKTAQAEAEAPTATTVNAAAVAPETDAPVAGAAVEA